MVESGMKQTVQNQHLGGDWIEDQSYQRENTHRSTHKRGEKKLLIFLKKCEKAGEEDTLTDGGWVMKPWKGKRLGREFSPSCKIHYLGALKMFFFPPLVKMTQGWTTIIFSILLGFSSAFLPAFLFSNGTLVRSLSSPVLPSSWLKGKIFVMCFNDVHSNRLIINTWCSDFSGHRMKKDGLWEVEKFLVKQKDP